MKVSDAFHGLGQKVRVVGDNTNNGSSKSATNSLIKINAIVSREVYFMRNVWSYEQEGYQMLIYPKLTDSKLSRLAEPAIVYWIVSLLKYKSSNLNEN